MNLSAEQLPLKNVFFFNWKLLLLTHLLMLIREWQNYVRLTYTSRKPEAIFTFYNSPHIDQVGHHVVNVCWWCSKFWALRGGFPPDVICTDRYWECGAKCTFFPWHQQEQGKDLCSLKSHQFADLNKSLILWASLYIQCKGWTGL